jgi:hypothetical protein
MHLSANPLRPHSPVYRFGPRIGAPLPRTDERDGRRAWWLHVKSAAGVNSLLVFAARRSYPADARAADAVSSARQEVPPDRGQSGPADDR